MTTKRSPRMAYPGILSANETGHHDQSTAVQRFAVWFAVTTLQTMDSDDKPTCWAIAHVLIHGLISA
ncbi:hypothetical protein TNCV_2193251 [Trichonephila clavipes]|nr:hypothetical protein TNCV_2193251 [Trichonephila clavipes]